MRKVFISYSRDDTDMALGTKSILQEAGIPCFIDTNAISPGDYWQNIIQKELNDSFVLVLICTNHSMTSKEVLFEWAYAMGQNIPIVPIIFEKNCELHSRLRSLSYLDFSDSRNRNYHSLLDKIKSIYEDRDIVQFNKVGIESIFMSRNKLYDYFAIEKILKSVRHSSEVIIIARSLEAWARDYSLLEKAINEKSIKFNFGVVDPMLSKEKWMITSDYAMLDLKNTLDKLNLIQINENSNGSIKIHLLPSSPLLSFVYFSHNNNYEVGILEIGASLGLNERTAFILKTSDNQDSILQRLHKMYSRVISSHPVSYNFGKLNNEK